MVSNFPSKELPKCNPFAPDLCYPVLIIASLYRGVSVVISFPFASLLPCAFALSFVRFALSADCSHSSATTVNKLHGGGITGANRCTGAISADLAEHPALQICQFSGFSAASRQSNR